MNDIVPISPKQSSPLPVRQMDDLSRRVLELVNLSSGDALPAHARSTVAELKSVMAARMTRADILYALELLVAQYGGRGDAETRADTMVELLLAEDASRHALVDAIIRLIRPIPGEVGDMSNGFVDTPPRARTFLPTTSEIINEVRARDECWRNRLASIRCRGIALRLEEGK